MNRCRVCYRAAAARERLPNDQSRYAPRELAAVRVESRVLTGSRTL
jgi:hypothetical protein